MAPQNHEQIVTQALSNRDVTPHNKVTKGKTPKTPLANVRSQNLPPNIFSPVQGNAAAPTTSASSSDGFLSLENFTSGTVFFETAEDLDELGSHGTNGDKINLVRNSLFVKFDPLVAGRKSLAHFLSKPEEESEEDLRRGSGLMHFSPSPTKKQKNESPAATPGRLANHKITNETLEFSAIDDTVLHEASKNENDISLKDVTIIEKVCEELPSSANMMANEDVKELLRRQEQVFQERLKELLVEQGARYQEKIKQQELIAQDSFLRHMRETEEVQKKMKQELIEHGIVISQAEEENDKLKKTVLDLQTVFKKLMAANEAMEKEHKEKMSILDTKYEAISASQRQEIQQWQDDLKKTEDGFFDIAKRYERLRDATKTIHHNEQKLNTQNDDIKAELSQKKEAFKEAIQNLEEKYAKIQQELENEKIQKDQEIKKAQVMLRRAEVKILSLNDTISKKNEELERQKALLDEIITRYY